MADPLSFKQDKPPLGGYGPIQIARKLPKRISGITLFAVYMGMFAVGYTQYLFDDKRRRRIYCEEQDSRLALEPLIIAERDRAQLKHLRQVRDEEAEIMKNVEGWEVGKWRGEPVYWNIPDRYPPLSPTHYYLHASDKDMDRRVFEKWWH